MGIFGSKNICRFSSNCPLGTEPCMYCASKNFEECSIYRQLNGDDNPCPLKDHCSWFPYSCMSEEYESCFMYINRDNATNNDDIEEDVDEEDIEDDEEDVENEEEDEGDEDDDEEGDEEDDGEDDDEEGEDEEDGDEEDEEEEEGDEEDPIKPYTRKEKVKHKRHHSFVDIESKTEPSLSAVASKTNAKLIIRIFAVTACLSLLLIGVFICILFSNSSQRSSEDEDMSEMVEDANSNIPADSKVTEKLESKYDLVEYEYGLYHVLKGDYYGLCDREGKEICKPQFDYIGGMEDGLIEVMKGDKSGYINTDGKIVIPCEYDLVSFDDGVIECTKGDKTLLFDKEGHQQGTIGD